MDYEIYPLSITQVEWNIFIDVCQRVLGYSPTRGIDASHLSIKDPAAYLGSFDLGNQPLAALRDIGNPGHGHFSISFLLILDEDGLLSLCGSGLRLFTRSAGRKRLVILTGTMDQWYHTIRNGCRDDASYEFRWIMNNILGCFEKAGFREVFSSLKKTLLRDETFILK